MATDQLIKFYDESQVELTISRIPLSKDKNFHLVRVFEVHKTQQKKHIRTDLILVGDNFITPSFCDTIHLIEELRLFSDGNSQNKYFELVEYQKVRNLKLKDYDKNLYISKSEASAIVKLFNLSYIGYSTAHLLENEFNVNGYNLTELIFKKI